MSDNNYIELIDESIVKAINDFKQEEYLIRKSNSTPELNKLWFKKEKQANLNCLKTLNKYCKSKLINLTKQLNPNKVTSLQLSDRKILTRESSFYFSNINRKQAELLLYGQDNGVFLIRNSLTHNKLTLSLVVNQNKFEHYLIKTQSITGYYSLNELNWFKTLDQLILHYQLDKDDIATELSVALSNNCEAIKHYSKIDQKYIISLNKLNLKEIIGSGEFGIVHKATLNLKLVAVKQLKNVNLMHDILHEAQIMIKLSHPNIIKLHGLVIQGVILLITQYMAKGSLLGYLQTRGRNQIPIEKLHQFSYDICSGMEYLERNNIIHCDLCASNVLLDNDENAKISDFGLSIINNNLLSFKKTKRNKLRIRWCAPETLNEELFTSKSDVYSYGITLWEIYSYGRTPYPHIALDDLKHIISSGYQMLKPDLCPENIYTLMTYCWNLNWKKRPSFQILLKRFEFILFLKTNSKNKN